LTHDDIKMICASARPILREAHFLKDSGR